MKSKNVFFVQLSCIRPLITNCKKPKRQIMKSQKGNVWRCKEI